MAGVLRQGFFGPGEARATSISRSGSVRSEQRSLERKGLPPFGLRPVWPVASLLVGHSPTCGGCSLLAPRHRPNWAQQNTSHLGDTTLGPQERSFLQFQECLLELFLRVHHDGAVPGDRFLEWLSGNQQEPNAVLPGLHLYLVAGVEEHQRSERGAGR